MIDDLNYNSKITFDDGTTALIYIMNILIIGKDGNVMPESIIFTFIKMKYIVANVAMIN